jgi:hypothetical protein
MEYLIARLFDRTAPLDGRKGPVVTAALPIVTVFWAPIPILFRNRAATTRLRRAKEAP